MATDSVKTRQARREKARLWLKEKKDKPCVDCNQKYPSCVMSYDHLPGYKKRKTISKMVLDCYSLDAIRKEIAKCELVCCNCHAIRTHITRK